MTREAIELLLKIISVIGFVVSIIAAGDQLLSGREEGRVVAGLELFATVVILGLVASLIQGISWAIIEARLGWRFGAGGGTEMPTGVQAIILSLTLTIPLLTVPAIYQTISGRQILLDNHLYRSLAVLVSAAVAHIIMYGTGSPKIVGFKEYLYPVGQNVTMERAVLTEIVYALMYFTAIVLVYQCAAGTRGQVHAIAAKYVLSMLMWLTTMATYITLKFPESITDKTWVQVRGVISAVCLQVALLAGMLL